MEARLPRTVFAVISCVYGSLWAASSARADTHTCDKVEAESFEIDGMMDDWRGFGAHTVGGSAEDRSYDLRCAYDSKNLYMSFDVRDQRIVRTKQAKAASEDNLVVSLVVGSAGSAGRLVVFPGDEDVAPVHTWNNKRAPKWLAVADSLQPKGWSVEVSLPLAEISGWSKGTPAINARISYNDKDGAKAKPKALELAGVLELSDGAELMKSFLAATKLKTKDIRLDVLANVDGTKGAERVIVAGKFIGVLSDTFVYMKLPVKKTKDVRSAVVVPPMLTIRAKVVDLRGDGTASIVVEYRERGNGGTRNLVVVFNVNGEGGFDRALAIEVRKKQGDNRLVNSWSLEPRGKYRNKKRKADARGHDIVVRADTEPIGWDEDNYYEQPAQDVHAILLPWEDDVSAVYYFVGNSVQGGDPIVGDKK